MEIDKLAKEEANASAEFAAASPDPDPSELMDDIYWETDNPEQKLPKDAFSSNIHNFRNVNYFI